jgi:uncharacterized protein
MMDVLKPLGERAPVVSYDRGGFGFAGGLRCSGSALILDHGVYAWDIADLADLTGARLQSLLTILIKRGAPPGFFLLGAGAQPILPPTEIRHLFLERRMGLEVMTTGAACRTISVLLAEGRNFAAGLIAV